MGNVIISQRERERKRTGELNKSFSSGIAYKLLQSISSAKLTVS